MTQRLPRPDRRDVLRGLAGVGISLSGIRGVRAQAKREKNAPVLTTGGEVTAQAIEHYTVVPGTLEVETCENLVAKWSKKAGLKDQGRRRKTRYGLVLEKGCLTGTFAVAAGEVQGEHGIVLNQLGFDYSGYCSAGAPRFNIYTTLIYDDAGDLTGFAGYFVGCASGTQTDLGNGWTRVRFQEEDFVPFNGGGAPAPGPFRYSQTVVDEAEIVMDEEGRVVLDNIAINSNVIDRP